MSSRTTVVDLWLFENVAQIELSSTRNERDLRFSVNCLNSVFLHKKYVSGLLFLTKQYEKYLSHTSSRRTKRISFVAKYRLGEGKKKYITFYFLCGRPLSHRNSISSKRYFGDVYRCIIIIIIRQIVHFRRAFA